MSHLYHGVIDLCHRVSDHYLVLAVGLHDLDHAVSLVEDIGVGLALVLQFEAQTGNAVGNAANVLFAAHILNDNAG